MKLARKPKSGEIYAVHSGAYAGEMLIFIDSDIDDYKFLSIPNIINRCVPKASFDLAWNSDIIEYVDDGPSDVISVCVKQYYYNENSNHRQ